jgi:hypothetical protein
MKTKLLLLGIIVTGSWLIWRAMPVIPPYVPITETEETDVTCAAGMYCVWFTPSHIMDSLCADGIHPPWPARVTVSTSDGFSAACYEEDATK